MSDTLPTVVWWSTGRHEPQLIMLRIRLCSIQRLVAILKAYRYSKWQRGFLKNGNTIETWIAVAREVRRRPTVGPYALMLANTVDPPPCACGRPGLYIVHYTTYCRQCKPLAVRRRTRVLVKYNDPEHLALDRAIKDRERERRAGEKHYAARGQRRGRRA